MKLTNKRKNNLSSVFHIVVHCMKRVPQLETPVPARRISISRSHAINNLPSPYVNSFQDMVSSRNWFGCKFIYIKTLKFYNVEECFSLTPDNIHEKKIYRVLSSLCPSLNFRFPLHYRD